MKNSERKSGGLGIIFSFFLGLVLTAFIGVGVYTFYPPPEQFESQIRDLDQQEQAIRAAAVGRELSIDERSRVEAISRQRSVLNDEVVEARKPWGRNTSIILIVFATIVMIVSLVRAEHLPVISNGLLLGGVFSMLYGIGWIIATDTSVSRFLVISAALAITLGLGYLRFVRMGRARKMQGEADEPEVMEQDDLERRLRDLEERMCQAAQVLGGA